MFIYHRLPTGFTEGYLAINNLTDQALKLIALAMTFRRLPILAYQVKTNIQLIDLCDGFNWPKVWLPHFPLGNKKCLHGLQVSKKTSFQENKFPRKQVSEA